MCVRACVLHAVHNLLRYSFIVRKRIFPLQTLSCTEGSVPNTSDGICMCMYICNFMCHCGLLLYCYHCVPLHALLCPCACAGREDPLDLELPNQWLWDIIDEFLYQVRQGSGGERGFTPT